MKYLGGRKYGRTAAWRVGLFLALVVGFPFVVLGVARLTGKVHSYEFIALAAGSWLRPLLLLLFLASLIRPSLRRASALGFPPEYGLIIPVLILADQQFSSIWEIHWAAGLLRGTFNLKLPICATTALFLIVLFSIAQPARASSLITRYGPFGRVAGAAVVAPAMLGAAAWFIGYVFALVIGVAPPAIAPFLIAPAFAAMQWLTWLQQPASLVAILCLLVLIGTEWLRRSDPQGAPYASA